MRRLRMEKLKLYNEDGSPRWVKCYEVKRNPTFDRFTIVFSRANLWGGKAYRGKVYYVGSSDSPAHPLGFYQHGESWRWEFGSCGSRISWQDLPEAVRHAVMADYRGLWKKEG
jgi:hypothetical protein